VLVAPAALIIGENGVMCLTGHSLFNRVLCLPQGHRPDMWQTSWLVASGFVQLLYHSCTRGC